MEREEAVLWSDAQTASLWSVTTPPLKTTAICRTAKRVKPAAARPLQVFAVLKSRKEYKLPNPSVQPDVPRLTHPVLLELFSLQLSGMQLSAEYCELCLRL